MSEKVEKKVKNKTIHNVDSDKIVITRDKLYCKLSKHYEKLGHRYDWIGAVALTVTLSSTLITSQFKPRFGIDPNVLTGVLFTLTVGSGAYTIYTCIKSYQSRSHKIEDVINDIFKQE